ncbi:hypothetical protein ACH4Q6_29590 [Streptomyces lydicus]|uniref:hypothetical protein n=1 Tax=Streptomyces lydicus TaxID=47763 RepID=UPI0037B76DE3
MASQLSTIPGDRMPGGGAAARSGEVGTMPGAVAHGGGQRAGSARLTASVEAHGLSVAGFDVLTALRRAGRLWRRTAGQPAWRNSRPDARPATGRPR